MKFEKESIAKIRRRRDVALILQSEAEWSTIRAIERKVHAGIPLEEWELEFWNMVPVNAD